MVVGSNTNSFPPYFWAVLATSKVPAAAMAAIDAHLLSAVFIVLRTSFDNVCREWWKRMFHTQVNQPSKMTSMM